MIESDYEFEQRATPAVLRREEYWSILAGATGQGVHRHESVRIVTRKSLVGPADPLGVLGRVARVNKL